MKLSSITPKGLVNAARMALLTPFALLARRRKPTTWLITERPNQARDNGYCFFKYMKEKHPEQPVYYIIDRKAKDYQKVAEYGNIIQCNSWKHYYYYCFAPIHISAHVGGCNPDHNPFAKRMKKILQYKDVFIPHGVSYGVAEFCLAKYAKIDLFICSGKPEYENVLTNYGYTKDHVAYTGFPRLDGWHHFQVKPNQIVLMPTWRMYLAQNPDIVFEETAYFGAYQSLINSPELSDLLVEKDWKLVFYLHNDMRKYVYSFHTNCPNIEVVYDDDIYDIQELLKESALLITDYSSVHFDFAYMGKLVLYYQFDREEFWKKQYQQSSFDAAKDGFGPIAYDLEQLIANLHWASKTGFVLQGEYERRMKAFYQLWDEHNCDRVYEEIVKHFD